MTALKLKMLWLYGLSGIREWYCDVWKQDGDQQMCCNGRECGCYGSTYASMWEHVWGGRNRT